MTINSLMMHHLHYVIYLMTFPLEEEKFETRQMTISCQEYVDSESLIIGRHFVM